MGSGSVQYFFQQLSSITQNYGVFGLGIGMFFESLGIPFASALVALTAGTLIAAGKTSFWGALFISTAGLTLGSIVSYYIGFWGGRLGSRLTGSCDERRKRGLFAEQYQRWGELTVLFAQLFGATRTWISLPAGAMKMRLQKFVAYTAIGGAIYCALAIGFSMALAKILTRALTLVNSSLHLFLLALSLVVILIAAGNFYRMRRVCQESENETE